MKEDQRHHLNKAAMRAAFDNAASSYDEVAVLQREVATRLDERLDVINMQPGVILDLGVGTGFVCELIARRYPQAQLLAMDIAEAMLQKACARDTLQGRITPLCGDMENLPLREDSVDMIVSNLTLQWSTDLDQTFREFSRVLKPEGVLMFTTFGPDTLQELRASWSRADAHVHVNAFMDMHDIGDALMRCGLAEPVMDAEHIVLTYENVFTLMHDLKALGARNANTGRARNLTGKGKLQTMLESYEHYRQNGRLPATYEVIYGHAWATSQRLSSRSPARQAMQVEFQQYLQMAEQQTDKNKDEE